MDAVNFSELNELAGELLPERTVLSTVVTPYGGWRPDHDDDGYGSYSDADAYGGGGSHGGFETSSACQQNASPLSNSGLLGLFTSAQENTNACIPAQSAGGF